MENQQTYLEIEILEGKKYKLDARIVNVSHLIQQLLQENPNQLIKFVDLNEEQLQFVQKYLNLHDYDLSFSKTKQNVCSSQLSDNLLSKIDVQLFEQISVEQISQYLRVAVYLQIEPLKQVCIVALGTKIYIGDDEQSLQILRESYNIEDIYDDDIKCMKEKYPWAFCNSSSTSNNNNNMDLEQE